MNYEYDDEYSVYSETGCLMLYECENYYFIDFKSIYLYSRSGYDRIQGEYVIFDIDPAKLNLEVECLSKFCKDYDSLDLNSIDKPAIILHRKYIHKLTIGKDLEKNLNFLPTKRLNLDFYFEYKPKSGGLIEYLNTHLFHN